MPMCPMNEYERHIRLARRHLLEAFGVLALIIAIGTIGFSLVEGWTLWRSMFFTLVTVTTVGYGDEGIGDNGRLFTVALLLGGVAAATFGFGQLLQSAFSYRLAWRHRMQKVIATLSNHVIVCGLGAVGRRVCERLREEGRDFVAIDQDAEHCQHAEEHGALVMQGDATDDDVLRQAGVTRASDVVCAMSDDAANIVATLSARELNPQITIIGRASESAAHRKVQRAGATHVVLPAFSGAREIANLLLNPELAEFLQSVPNSDAYRLIEMLIDDDSPLINTSLRDIGKCAPGVTFVAHRRRGESRSGGRPSPDTVLADGDALVLVGSTDDLKQLQTSSIDKHEPELTSV